MRKPEILKQLWNQLSLWIWWGLAVLLSLSVCNRLWHGFARLIWRDERSAAIDLRVFSEGVRLWFDGAFVYGELSSAVYPPASYLMLWPLMGWLDFSPARVLWAVVTVACLAWLIALLIKESRVEALPIRILVGLLPLFYATRGTIGNAQLGTVILPALVAGLLLYRRAPQRWQRDVAATALMTWALVKPSLTAPFFWIALFACGPKKWWPGFCVALTYLSLSTIAVKIQPGGELLPLMEDWLARAREGADHGASQQGYASQLNWNLALQIQAPREGELTQGEEAAVADARMDDAAAKIAFPVDSGWKTLLDLRGEGSPLISLLMLGGLGAWVYRCRKVDLWLLMGVAAIIARMWTYHRPYDDILMVLPTLAVVRLMHWHSAEEPASTGNHRSRTWQKRICATVLAAAALMAVVPSNVLEAPPPWGAAFVLTQTGVWLLLLVYLIWQAERERSAGCAAATQPL